MKRRLCPVIVSSLLGVLPLLGGEARRPDEPAPTRLVVHVEGLQSRRGSLALALFADEESFDRRSDAVRAEFVPLRSKRCKWVVDDLPPGSYALVAYHDENGNGQLDRRKLLGIPSEPYGFSNDARGSFGPPPFEAARFEVPGGSAKITIRMR